MRVEFRQQPARLEQFQQHHVAHAEAERGQVHFAAADELDEVVVASAAGDGAELALAVERLEHDAGVIGQAANDAIINLHEIAAGRARRVLQDAFQFRRRLAGFDEFVHVGEGKAERGQFFLAFLPAASRSSLSMIWKKSYSLRVVSPAAVA